MKYRNHYVLPALSTFVLASLGCSGFAQDATHATMNKHADITKLCGDKPAVVALTDGFGGATWFKTAAAEFKDEMSKCPNVKKITYLDANNDQQKYNSDINSLVADGANVIVSFTHFGDASLPTFRKVTKAGVTMVPYFTKLNGRLGKDYAGNIYQDPAANAKLWADWLAKTVKSGNVVFLGGPAGASSSQRFMDEFTKAVATHPGLKLLDTNYIVTNWNPVDGQKAAAALIAKYPKLDGIASDYGVTTMAAVKAYQQAGLPVPAQATLASSMELNCKYLDDKKANKSWRYMSLDGTTSLVRFAARRALSLYENTKDDEPDAVVPYVYADSEANITPVCDSGLPPDADPSGQLGISKLKTLLAQ